MNRERVLALLREKPGQYISGESMSHVLGISRAAVWKVIQGLRSEGYDIVSAPNRGYCLVSSPDRLTREELAGPLQGCRIGSQLLCLETIDSTNTEAKRRALLGVPEGLVVLSEEQSGGRGRLGRSFQSPKGTGLYLSVLLRPNIASEKVVNVTAWVAVAVCDGVEAACGVRPQIKWPNDLVLGGKKLGGILTEMGLEGNHETLQYIVTGIGLNVNHQMADFQEDIRDIATSLAVQLGHSVRRVDLALSIIKALDEMYQAFPQGKKRYLEQYRADCLTSGKHVRLITGSTVQEAYVTGIDDDFHLMVEYPDGTTGVVAAGEVSVRGMYGYT